MDESLRALLEFANFGTNGLLLGGLWIVWRKLEVVLREKDVAMRETIEILRTLVKDLNDDG